MLMQARTREPGVLMRISLLLHPVEPEQQTQGQAAFSSETGAEPSMLIQDGRQIAPELLDLLLLARCAGIQRVCRQAVGQCSAVASPVEPQAPARPLFAAILAACGPQDKRPRISQVQALENMAGIGLLGLAERLVEPLRRLGSA